MKRAALATFALPALLAAGCTDAAAPTGVDQRAKLAKVTNERTPLVVQGTNPCTGEPLTLVGEQHVLFHVTRTPTGAAHVDMHLDLHLSGVGPVTGTEYLADATVNDHRNVTLGAASNFTTVANAVVVSKGSAPNFAIKVLAHVTTNANGDVTSEKSELVLECRG